MMNEHISELLARKLSGESSPEELEKLQAIIAEDSEVAALEAALTAFWPVETNTSVPEPEDAGFQHLLSLSKTRDLPAYIKEVPPKQSGAPVRIISFKFWMAAAAGILVAVAGAYFLFRGKSEPKNPVAITHPLTPVVTDTTLVAMADSTLIHLPDGSTVVLQKDARLTYDPAFPGITRDVTLEGDAYFDVVHNADKPFRVHASDMTLKELGTAFYVRNNPRDSVIEALLVRGLIEVTYKAKPGQKNLLNPNDSLVYHREDMMARVITAEERETALLAKTAPEKVYRRKPVIRRKPVVDNTADSVIGAVAFSFNKESFKTVAKKLETIYPARIKFTNNTAGKIMVTGNLKAEKNIEDALKSLQQTTPFDYKISNYALGMFKRNKAIVTISTAAAPKKGAIDSIQIPVPKVIDTSNKNAPPKDSL